MGEVSHLGLDRLDRAVIDALCRRFGGRRPAFTPRRFGLVVGRWFGEAAVELGTIALSLMFLAGYGGMVSLLQMSIAGMAGYMVAILGLVAFTLVLNHLLSDDPTDWPTLAQTMVGRKRLDQLQTCVESVLRDGVPGDLIETGVWRGGSVIFMRAILAAWGAADRTVWVADSFEGLPKPDAERYPADANDRHWTHPQLAVSLEQVRAGEGTQPRVLMLTARDDEADVLVGRVFLPARRRSRRRQRAEFGGAGFSECRGLSDPPCEDRPEGERVKGAKRERKQSGQC